MIRYNVHTLDHYRYNILHFYLTMVYKYSERIAELYEMFNAYSIEELSNIKLQKPLHLNGSEQWIATKVERGDRGADHIIIRKNRQTYMPLYEAIPISSYPQEVQNLFL